MITSEVTETTTLYPIKNYQMNLPQAIMPSTQTMNAEKRGVTNKTPLVTWKPLEIMKSTSYVTTRNVSSSRNTFVHLLTSQIPFSAYPSKKARSTFQVGNQIHVSRYMLESYMRRCCPKQGPHNFDYLLHSHGISGIFHKRSRPLVFLFFRKPFLFRQVIILGSTTTLKDSSYIEHSYHWRPNTDVTTCGFTLLITL